MTARGKLLALSAGIAVGAGILVQLWPDEGLAGGSYRWLVPASVAAAAALVSWLAPRLVIDELRTLWNAQLKLAEQPADAAVDRNQASALPAAGAEVTEFANRIHRHDAQTQDHTGHITAERDQLKTALQLMQDAVVVLDRNGIITLANEAAVHMFRSSTPVLGEPLSALADSAVLGTLLDRALAGETVTRELTVEQPVARTLQIRSVPLAALGVALVMHDITELRRLETMRRDFVANVSHELRTPVSVVRVNAETLLDGALDDELYARRFVSRIHRSAERLSHLVTDLLDLSRIEAGRYATKMDRVAVRNAVKVVMEDVSVQAEARNITVTVDVAPSLLAQADATGLEQILQNLIENAVRYTPVGGRVDVRGQQVSDQHVRIDVSDDGPGIAPQHRERIFERFYRVDSGRSREVGGTGLGLAIVKHLCELMGGAVGVDESEHGGSRFWVRLACVTADTASVKGVAT